MHTEGGKWRHDKPVWTHWCDGFLPGMMWMFHRSLGPGHPKATSGSSKRSGTRGRWSRGNSTTKFTISDSFSCPPIYRWYQFTQDPKLNEVLVQAGQTLAQRFNHERETSSARSSPRTRCSSTS